jgi:hypothetical protein
MPLRRPDAGLASGEDGMTFGRFATDPLTVGQEPDKHEVMHRSS